MFGLSFLYPAFLLGAAAAAVPIILHLWRRPAAPTLAFTAVRFIRRQPPERAKRRSLRELLLLALRVATLAALAVGFARPFLAAGAPGLGDLTVILLDDSFSMSASARMARARAEVAHLVDAMRPGARAALLVFDTAPRVVVASGRELSGIRSAAAQVRPSASGTRYRPAIERALSLFDGSGGRIVMVSDLHRAGWDAGDRVTLPPGVALAVRPMGDATGNLAVTDVSIEDERATATIRNFAPAARASMATLRVNGRELATAPVQVPAEGSETIAFEAKTIDRGFASVEVHDAEGAAADNRYFRVLDAPPQIPVLCLVAASRGPIREALYLERALNLGADSPFRITSAPADRASGLALTDYAAVILLGARGADRQLASRLQQFVSQGGGLLAAAGDGLDGHTADWALAAVAPGHFSDPVDAGATKGLPFLTLQPADARHPVFRVFDAGQSGDLGRARFFRMVKAEPDRAGRVLASFDNGDPALIERRVGAGTVMLFASDLGGAWNDFPLRATFLPFLHETLRYLAVGRAAEHALQIGDQAPPAVRHVDPGSEETPGAAAQTPSARIEVPGIYEVRDNHGGVRRVAVNVDSSESNLAPMTEIEFRAPIASGVGAIDPAGRASADRRAVESAQALWWYSLLFALVVLVLEGALASRTV